MMRMINAWSRLTMRLFQSSAHVGIRRNQVSRKLTWQALGAILALSTANGTAAQYGDFTYTDNGSNITITRCSTSASYAVTVPSYIAGKPVVEIGYQAFYNCYGITSLVIPNSVSNIRSQAFGYCTKLTSIRLPFSITRIEESTFFRCSALPSLTIPPGVTLIG